MLAAILTVNLTMSALVISAYTVLMYGFVQYAKPGDEVVRPLAQAMCLLIVSACLADLIWCGIALLHVAANDDTIRFPHGLLLAMRISYMILLVMLLAAARLLFGFFYELIPSEDQPYWHWIMAPFYPRARGIIAKR